MINIICLNEEFSSAKILINEKQCIDNKTEDKFESVLFLPMNEELVYEGGLRGKDYFKKSYKAKPLISIVTVV